VSARAGRLWPAVLCALGGITLAVGLALAYLTREDPSPAVALGSVLLGSLLVLAGSVWAVRRERADDDLVRPDGSGRLPAPAWWYPVGAAGSVDLAAGPAVSGWIGLGGAVLVAAAAVGAGRALIAPATGPDRTVVRAARRLRAVAGPAHTEPAGGLVGALEPVGRSGVRLVAVGPDGRWADVMLGTADRARATAELAGVELHEQTDPAFSRRFSPRRPSGPG